MRAARQLWLRVGLELSTAGALLVVVAPPGPATSHTMLGTFAASATYLLLPLAVVAAVVRERAVDGAWLRPALSRAGLLGLLAACEEITWRRVVLGEALRWGALAAWAASALGFALGHRARPGRQLATGAAFGGLYLATGSLTVPICAHWSYNLLVPSPATRTLRLGCRP